MKKYILFALVFCMLSGVVFAQVEEIVSYEMNDRITMNIQPNGDVKAKEEIELTAVAYQAIKAAYPNWSAFMRLFKPENTPIQMVDLNLDADDMANKITADYTLKGASVNKGDYWELEASSPGTKIILASENKDQMIFTYSENIGGFKITTTTTVNFPPGAKNLEFDSSKNLVSYELNYSPAVGRIIFLAFGIICLILVVINHYVVKFDFWK